MPITDLIPWKKKEPDREEEERALQVRQDPFLAFQQQMNRMFDEFVRGSGLAPFGAFRHGIDPAFMRSGCRPGRCRIPERGVDYHPSQNGEGTGPEENRHQGPVGKTQHPPGLALG